MAARHWKSSLLWLFALTQKLDIQSILRSARRELVRNELTSPEKTDTVLTERRVESLGPRFREHDAVDAGHDIDAKRRTAERGHPIGLREFGLCAAQLNKPELRERFTDAPSVFGGRFDPNVQILRSSRPTVRRQCVRSHDQKADAVGKQQADKLAPVGG